MKAATSLLRNPYVWGLLLLLLFAAGLTWYMNKRGLPAMMSGKKYLWPLPGYAMGSGDGSDFGPRTPPVAGASSNHQGIDIPAPVGTLVLSPVAGLVNFIGVSGSAGKWMKIQDAEGLTWVFMHLNDWLVELNERVSQGEPVALTGNTGNSGGPHLHLAVLNTAQTYIDPEPLFA